MIDHAKRIEVMDTNRTKRMVLKALWILFLLHCLIGVLEHDYQCAKQGQCNVQ